MSCSDSDSPNKEQAVDGSDMGDVIGKEADEAENEEMSSEIPEIGTERQDADGAPSNEDQRVSSTENHIFSCDVSTLCRQIFHRSIKAQNSGVECVNVKLLWNKSFLLGLGFTLL